MFCMLFISYLHTTWPLTTRCDATENALERNLNIHCDVFDLSDCDR